MKKKIALSAFLFLTTFGVMNVAFATAATIWWPACSASGSGGACDRDFGYPNPLDNRDACYHCCADDCPGNWDTFHKCELCCISNTDSVPGNECKATAIAPN